jgi:hypothetical protein
MKNRTTIRSCYTTLLGVYLKESKSAYNRDACTSTFITAPFTIAKIWNQPTCPSMDEWRTVVIYMQWNMIQTKNEIMSFAGKWVEIEIITPNKPDSERQVSHVFSHMWSLYFIKKKNT